MPTSAELQLKQFKQYTEKLQRHLEAGVGPLQAVKLIEREHPVELLVRPLHALGRNHLPQALSAMAPLLLDWGLSSKIYWELVRDAWTGCEWPLQWLPARQWRKLFRHAEPYRMMTLEEQALLAAQGKLFDVYRGVSGMGGNWRKRLHWSWTLDKDRAVWFAKRLGGAAPMLMKMRVDQSEVFALLDSRSEKEILIPFYRPPLDYIITSYL